MNQRAEGPTHHFPEPRETHEPTETTPHPKPPRDTPAPPRPKPRLRPQTQPPPPYPPPSPKPPELFLGNSGDQENGDCLRAYNDFYQGLNALGRFTLVDTPAAADLILELHYEISLGASVVTDHNGDSVRQFRVIFLDPASHVVLWSITERTNYAIRQKNRNRNLDDMVSALVADTTCCSPPGPSRRATTPARPTINRIETS